MSKRRRDADPQKPLVDIQTMHEERMEMYHNRTTKVLPEMKLQLKAFQGVLADDGTTMTDAMANAVFKDHGLLKNARFQEKARRKRANGEDKKLLADSTETLAPDDESYDSIQQKAKNHTNRLRRLKGKSGSRLDADEIDDIKHHMNKLRRDIVEYENNSDYIEYVFKALPIIQECEVENTRISAYLDDENEEMHDRAIEQVTKRIDTGNSPKAIEAGLGVIPARRTAAGGLLECVAQSDIYARTGELQRDYYDVIGECDPTGGKRYNSEYSDFCKVCHLEMIVNTAEATRTCPGCGISLRFTDNSLRAVPFGDPINAPRSKGTYEKRTYYEKWKKQVSGELRSSIPDEDWSVIYKECVSLRLRVVSREIIRKMLQRLDMSQYYDLVPVITNELNDVPLIKFSKSEEAALDAMFDEALALFHMCPYEIKQRQNYISYSYHFFQCCQMLGYNEYLPAFGLLEGPDNLRHHDRIWEWMCENKKTEPKWVFIPTC